MNTNHSRRLDVLESHIVGSPADAQNERKTLEWLSTPSVVTVIVATAHITAERRWLFEHGREACGRDPWGGVVLGREHGWLWLTDEDDRDALTFSEVDRLERRLAGDPFFDALREWCEDDVGLVPYWHATDYTRFRDKLQQDRTCMAIHRGQNGQIGDEWRRRYPEWRPGMTEDEYDEWELALLSAGEKS